MHHRAGSVRFYDNLPEFSFDYAARKSTTASGRIYHLDIIVDGGRLVYLLNRKSDGAVPDVLKSEGRHDQNRVCATSCLKLQAQLRLGFQPDVPLPVHHCLTDLRHDKGLRQHILLSSLASKFEALAKDSVAVTGNLEDVDFTWDEDKKLALYETSSDKGVVVRKIRRFKEVDRGAATRVSETIDGQCPALLQLITQTTARKAHKENEPVPHALRGSL
ncbi:hypothetical protein B0H17DRAFT_1148508 [Mycena rosella]|uniref:Uncharacterized protein n=1 Tax=Mycena rosella TaxID=1033263 RepID=A0AAD7CCT2_MYCRO|nr:hypothetical protein B0H17DRAFT_1148508 [Mycena rosella]